MVHLIHLITFCPAVSSSRHLMHLIALDACKVSVEAKVYYTMQKRQYCASISAENVIFYGL